MDSGYKENIMFRSIPYIRHTYYIHSLLILWINLRFSLFILYFVLNLSAQTGLSHKHLTSCLVVCNKNMHMIISNFVIKLVLPDGAIYAYGNKDKHVFSQYITLLGRHVSIFIISEIFHLSRTLLQYIFSSRTYFTV